MSLSDLRVFVFVKRGAAADEAGGSSAAAGSVLAAGSVEHAGLASRMVLPVGKVVRYPRFRASSALRVFVGKNPEL